MADLTFAKIPLLLTSIWFVRVVRITPFTQFLTLSYSAIQCGRSPQPTPKKAEESKFTGLEVRGFRAIIRWVPPLLVLVRLSMVII